MTISNTPHLVVFREANPDDGTNLHEFWKLDSCFWRGHSVNPLVKVYVAPWSGTADEGRDGLPIKEERASDSCSWDEAPQEIRDAFREEANKLQQSVEGFK